jgi:glycerol uptake facilitator-like aquaporin
MGFDVARRFEGRMVAPYLLSQCLGAILASITLRLMFRECAQPDISSGSARISASRSPSPKIAARRSSSERSAAAI